MSYGDEGPDEVLLKNGIFFPPMMNRKEKGGVDDGDQESQP